MNLSNRELHLIIQGLLLRLGVDSCNGYKEQDSLHELLGKLQSEFNVRQMLKEDEQIQSPEQEK